MKKEAITHGVLEDLANRNENWDKLDGVPEKVNELQESRLILKNEIVNGDFSDGVVGWGVEEYVDTSVIDNEITGTMNKSSSSQSLYQFINGFNQGDVSYISFDMNRSLVGMETIWNGVLKLNWNYPATNVWKKQSSILQPFDIAKNTVLGLYIKTQVAEVGDYLKLRNVLMVNLTQIFGAGNEPTKEEMDRLVEMVPNQWWDGELDLTQQQCVNWLLSFIREKANKQQEAWITPTLLNGASSMEGFPVQYMKDSLGFVHWKGRLTGGTASNLIDIPVGYRPLTETTFALSGNTINVWNRVSVYPNGRFYQYYIDRTYTMLDAIVYRAEL